MDLKFTFEDGSESLAHYGVKGMKWGKHLPGALDFDAEKYGYENTQSGRESALAEAGLNEHMTRESAIRKVLENHKESNKAHPVKTIDAAAGRMKSLRSDLSLAGHLESASSKKSRQRKRQALRKLNRLLGN